MKILMGASQIKTKEEFERIQEEKLRTEFWKENIELLVVGVGGGAICALALVGLCTWMGM